MKTPEELDQEWLSALLDRKKELEHDLFQVKMLIHLKITDMHDNQKRMESDK